MEKKHYYLKDNRIWMANEKMPTQSEWNTYFIYNHEYNNWLNALQPCEISEIELDKIDDYLYSVYFCPKKICEDIIDVTNLISDNNGVITFKSNKNKNMKKPLVMEVCADNGEFSHWSLIDLETSVKLWSENPEECKAMGYPVEHPKQVDGEIEAVNNLPQILVDKFIKSFGDNEIPIDEMYYNESKSNGINMRSFLEDFAEDIINHFS